MVYFLVFRKPKPAGYFNWPFLLPVSGYARNVRIRGVSLKQEEARILDEISSPSQKHGNSDS
jgi:hypothetical protein